MSVSCVLVVAKHWFTFFLAVLCHKEFVEQDLAIFGDQWLMCMSKKQKNFVTCVFQVRGEKARWHDSSSLYSVCSELSAQTERMLENNQQESTREFFKTIIYSTDYLWDRLVIMHSLKCSALELLDTISSFSE